MKHFSNLLFVCFSVFAIGQTTNFKTTQPFSNLYRHALFANAGNESLQLENLDNAALKFETLTSENHSVGFTTDFYWVKFNIENNQNEKQIFYLETARPITDLVELYIVAKNDTIIHRTGDQISYSQRKVKHRSSIFKIELEPSTTQQYFIHYKSDGETLNLPLNLYSEDDFWQMNYSQQLFLGLFYGLLFLAGIIYLFFFTSLKEKTFLYYGIYVFSIALLQGALDGFIFQYFFPSGGFINDRAVMIAALLSNFFLLKYCEYFLKVDQKAKFFRKAYKVIYWVLGILALIVMMGDHIRSIAYPLSNINGLMSLILILTTLVYMRYKKIKVDKFFSVGIFFLVIGLLGFVMNNLSLLPNNFYVLNSAKFGIGLEVIFLSLSMTNLIRDLRLKKEESQAIALRKSQEISDLKSYFMSNMSHELRTPINAIMGIAESQLIEENQNENTKNFEIIKHASISLLSSINDILDFEKIEKKQLKLRPDNFELPLALRQISDNWKVMAENKGLKYQYVSNSRSLPHKVYGDYERFIQIANNVLSNAVKFTQAGTIEFKAESIIESNNVCKLILKIKDTGVGMTLDKKDGLFDSFSQMKLDDKRSFGGIGLGLTIVKHLVELFDGSLIIDSEHGKGTETTIIIPLKVVEFNNPEKVTNVSKQFQNKNEVKILIVEDNVMNQLIIKKIVGAVPNFECKIAANGKEAIGLLMEESFDMVLMDLQMPVMDGYEATTIIRKGNLGNNLKDIPIIAVTADATEKARQKVFDCGMSDYMTKPVKKELLIEKITKLSDANLKIA
ncbi:7TM diverse intracellular signaling domain-containing protein [Paucihalobacter sp.]|uniref:7TM diverse intracellular signaling domain-containing protein n=1 Tax=Paucihalobacter sp. TaxID=2850405 RepID=UPI002FE160BD